jgi:hypothetical protein
MANSAVEWTKILVHPLGLVGYVLSLLFGSLSRVRRRDERRWILPLTLALAIIALLGGLGLAYRDVSGKVRQTVIVPAPKPEPTLQQQNDHPQQSSTGNNSPNLQGIQGNVKLAYGEDSTTEAQKSPQRKRSSLKIQGSQKQ